MRNWSVSLVVLLLASTAVLSACSESSENTAVERVTTVDIEEAPQNPSAFEEAREAQADIARATAASIVCTSAIRRRNPRQRAADRLSLCNGVPRTE